MSEKALSALVNIGSRRRGTTVPASISHAVLAELSALGYIGPKGGLTDKGSVARQKIMDELLPW